MGCRESTQADIARKLGFWIADCGKLAFECQIFAKRQGEDAEGDISSGEIRTSMGASVEQSGSIVVSSTLFPAILAKLPEENVDLEIEVNGRLAIRSGHSCFRLDVLPGDKYPMPELPFPDDTLPVSGLCSLTRNTAFAAAEDNTKSPFMKCVQLRIGPEGLKACSSNGFCIMEADGDKQCKGKSDLLLPSRSLKTLASISKDSDVYEMGLAGKSLVFWSGTLLFSARLAEGRFPEVGAFFQNFACEYSVHLNAGELRDALETVAALAESNARIELAFGEHEIVLSAESAYGELGKNRLCRLLCVFLLLTVDGGQQRIFFLRCVVIISLAVPGLRDGGCFGLLRRRNRCRFCRRPGFPCCRLAALRRRCRYLLLLIRRLCAGVYCGLTLTCRLPSFEQISKRVLGVDAGQFGEAP